jgi:hypothetical protein
MRKFTKLAAVALSALAVFFTTDVKAQTTKPGGWSLSIGIEPGIPTGNATDISSFEIGGTGRLEYNASANLAVMFTAGYYDFMGKTSTLDANVKYTSLEMVPAKVGVKYYVAPMFYIDGEAGFGFDMNYQNHTKLIVSGGAGYASNMWDIGVRYENYSGQSNSFGLLGLRAAYSFGL